MYLSVDLGPDPLRRMYKMLFLFLHFVALMRSPPIRTRPSKLALFVFVPPGVEYRSEPRLEVRNRPAEAFHEFDARLPAKLPSGECDVGLTLPRIVLRQGLVDDPRR